MMGIRIIAMWCPCDDGDNNDDVIFNLIMVIAMLLTDLAGDDDNGVDGDKNDDVKFNSTIMTITIATVPTWPVIL